MNDHKEHKHKGIGPGGTDCPCCLLRGCSKKETKQTLNRHSRRTMKQQDKKQDEND